VLVSGELGTGKTTLIRGACRALGVTEPVTSPTFTIGQRYRGRVPVSHLDLYRLEGLDAEEPGLLDDYVTPDAIAFIELPGGAEPEVITNDTSQFRGLTPPHRQPLRNDTSQFRGLKPPHRHTRVALRVELAHDGGDHRLITVRRS
jgi:hypothetical protein